MSLDSASESELCAVYKSVFDDKEALLSMMSTIPMKIELEDDAVLFCVAGPRPVPLALENEVRKELKQMG